MSREDVIREINERYRLAGFSLNEVQRRQWAALEALKLGRGGIALVSRAIRISPNTIRKGIREVETGSVDLTVQWTGRVRRSGGGRKSSRLEPLHTAGSLAAPEKHTSDQMVEPLADAKGPGNTPRR